VDEFSCSLTTSGDALAASGACKWQRDGSMRTLSLKR
jgi:hypothetical protein